MKKNLSTYVLGLCSILSLSLTLMLVASGHQATAGITRLLGVPAASAIGSTGRPSRVDVPITSVTWPGSESFTSSIATVDQVPAVLAQTEPEDVRGSSAGLPRRIGVVGERVAGLEEVVSLISSGGGELSWVYDTNIGCSSRVDRLCAGWEVERQFRLGLEAKLADHDTGVVVVAMRPAHLIVARRIADAASDAAKPVVFVLQGVDGGIRLLNRGNSNLYQAQTLDDAAMHAVALTTTDSP